VKKLYYAILTILSIVVLGLITFCKINDLAKFVDLTEYKHIIEPIINYGPIILMSFFAFGGLFGKVLSKILFVVIVLLLIILIVSIFAPDFVRGIFKVENANQIKNLLNLRI